MRLEITCVVKSDSNKPDKRISYVGGFFPDGKIFRLSQKAAIEHIEKNTYDFFVTHKGREYPVYVATLNNEKYIKSFFDTDLPLVLLMLPQCP